MSQAKSSSCGMGSDYNAHSQIQRQAFEHFWPWLEDTLVNNTSLLPFQTSQVTPISYVDYGCGGGANAAVPFQSVKKVLEETGFLGGDGSSQLQVTLVDVPCNDWNKVVEVFFKAGAVGCAEAILPSLVPKSFYSGEVAPPGSLHIGVTVDALHWLSHAPPHGSKDSISYHEAGPAVEEAFQKQSEADMDHFLRLRAREFAVNGLLLVVVPGAMGDSICAQAWFDSVNAAATAMAREGRIDASLLEDFMVPVYNATEDDLESIANKSGYWEVLQRGGTALTQLWDLYKASGDAAGYAHALIKMFWAAGGPLLTNRLALSDATAKELCERTEELIRSDPHKYVMRNIQVSVLLRRVKPRRSSDLLRMSTSC